MPRRLAVPYVVCALLLARCACAEELFPKPGWQDEPNPFASPDAVVGGEISISGHQYPKSFNYYLDNNSFSAELFGAMYETLLTRHPLTLEHKPWLAERWSISEDKKTFTFWLNKQARWSDGRPVTAEDVQWTFDAIMSPTNLTGVHKVALERFERPDVLDTQTVKFTARQVHWENLDAVGFMAILPKHAYADKDFNKINFEFPVVSGLYRLGEVQEGVFAKLERRADWWAKDAPSSRGVGNFQTLKFKFFAARENALEAFKKGLLDLFPIYTARFWVEETKGEKFKKNWIVKQKVYNYSPVGFQGFAMNARRPPFDDGRVRRAMAHLLDREQINRTLMYDQYFMHRSYYEDLYTRENPCPNENIAFDPAKARALLKEAGWAANPETGLLAKDGRTLRVKFLARGPDTQKYLANYMEVLKDAGIELKIDQKDWASWVKDMDTFNFDMTWAAWGAGLFKDPEPMWLSKEADREGGNNYTGYRNARVDELIEQQKTIFDVERRHAICREIDGIVCRDVPYVLLWNINYTRLLYWNKFGMPRTVLSKYGTEEAAYWLWWLDEDSTADLEDAMKEGKALPPRPAEVRFDDVFKR
ncbi:MAG: ABC transporter substrate-binding protein [Kiritimatiellae bacterium]|nr:ABC transporter substrate-binding protein [Kiritimatiellia bacterium]